MNKLKKILNIYLKDAAIEELQQEIDKRKHLQAIPDNDHGYIIDHSQTEEYMKKNNLHAVSDGGCKPVKVSKKKLRKCLEELSRKQEERLKSAGLL